MNISAANLDDHRMLEDCHFLGFLRLACALICFRRATRLDLLPSTNTLDSARLPGP